MDAALVPLLLTLKVALWATFFAAILGAAAGLLLARVRFPGRDAVDALLLLPMVLPPTVLGYYLLVAFGRGSALGRWLEGSDGPAPLFDDRFLPLTRALSSDADEVAQLFNRSFRDPLLVHDEIILTLGYILAP